MGPIHSLINNTAFGKPRNVKAFNSSTSVVWGTLNCGEAEFQVCAGQQAANTQINYRVQERLKIFSCMQSVWGHLGLGERALGTKSELWHFSQNKICSIYRDSIPCSWEERNILLPEPAINPHILFSEQTTQSIQRCLNHIIIVADI